MIAGATNFLLRLPKEFFFSGMLHFFHFPMFEQIDRIMLKMGTQIIGKLTTCCVRNRNQIFDTHGFFHLASDTLGNDGYFQSFSGRVDGCRRACRTTSYDQDVVFLFRDFLAGILRTVGRLQFSRSSPNSPRPTCMSLPSAYTEGTPCICRASTSA